MNVQFKYPYLACIRCSSQSFTKLFWHLFNVQLCRHKKTSGRRWWNNKWYTRDICSTIVKKKKIVIHKWYLQRYCEKEEDGPTQYLSISTSLAGNFSSGIRGLQLSGVSIFLCSVSLIVFHSPLRPAGVHSFQRLCGLRCVASRIFLVRHLEGHHIIQLSLCHHLITKAKKKKHLAFHKMSYLLIPKVVQSSGLCFSNKMWR